MVCVIKNLWMWNNIRVSICKMLLGLKTIAIYQRTQSIIVAKTKKQPQDDDRLRSILESSVKKNGGNQCRFLSESVPNGTYIPYYLYTLQVKHHKVTVMLKAISRI